MLNLVNFVSLLRIFELLGPENFSQMAIGDGQPNNGDNIGDQEENNLIAVV